MKKNDGEEKKDIYIYKVERFNKGKLAYILNHEETYKEKLVDKKSESAITLAKKYLKQSKCGEINVKHKQKNGRGRYCGVGNLSLQNMPRWIRHTIAEEFYWDIDIVNAHPVLITQMCERDDIPNKYMTLLVNEREQIFKLFMDDTGKPRDQVKDALLSIIYGGDESYKKLKANKIAYGDTTDFGSAFQDEIKHIHTNYKSMYPDLFQEVKAQRLKEGKRDKNHEGGLLSHLVCEEENKCLQAMLTYYDTSIHSVPCHDGALLLKGVDEELERNVRDKDFKNTEAYIAKKTGWKVKLKQKPMDQGLNLPTDLDSTECGDKAHNEYVSILYSLAEENRLDHTDIAELVEKLYNGEVIISHDKGNGYAWDEKERLWIPRSRNALEGVLMKERYSFDKIVNSALFKAHMNGQGEAVRERIYKFSKKAKCVSFYENIFKMLKKRDKICDDQFEGKLNMKQHLFPIKGGKVIELKTGKIRTREKGDLFSFSCPVEYVVRGGNDKRLASFIDPIYGGDKEYIEYKQMKFGSMLSGEIRQREFDIELGSGRNGKSAITAGVMKCMGGFCREAPKSLVSCPEKGMKIHNSAQHTADLELLRGARAIIVNELEEDDVLNTERVKKISSCDNITSRGLGKDFKEIEVFAKLVISSNHDGNIKTRDMAMVDRLNVSPYRSRFLTAEMMEKEKKSGEYNEEMYDYHLADEELADSFSVEGECLNLLFSWLVDGCTKAYKIRHIPKPAVVAKYTKKIIDDKDVVKHFIKEIFDTKRNEEIKQLQREERNKWRIELAEMYEQFSMWATQHGVHKGWGKVQFNKYIEARFRIVKPQNRKVVVGFKYRN